MDSFNFENYSIMDEGRMNPDTISVIRPVVISIFHFRRPNVLLCPIPQQHSGLQPEISSSVDERLN